MIKFWVCSSELICYHLEDVEWVGLRFYFCFCFLDMARGFTFIDNNGKSLKI